MKITSLPHHLRVYVPDSLNKNMPVGRALEALIHAAGGVTETRSTGGWFSDNMLSTCCGAPEGPAEGFCGKCQSGAGWEPDYVAEPVTVYEFWAPNALDPAKLAEAMLDAGQEAVMVIRNMGVWDRVPAAKIYEKDDRVDTPLQTC